MKKGVSSRQTFIFPKSDRKVKRLMDKNLQLEMEDQTSVIS